MSEWLLPLRLSYAWSRRNVSGVPVVGVLPNRLVPVRISYTESNAIDLAEPSVDASGNDTTADAASHGRAVMSRKLVSVRASNTER
jgi:hypothetical protein